MKDMEVPDKKKKKKKKTEANDDLFFMDPMKHIEPESPIWNTNHPGRGHVGVLGIHVDPNYIPNTTWTP